MSATPAHPTNEPNNYFAIGKQSARGSEASTFYFLKHLDGTGTNPDKTIESEREGGDGQAVGLRYVSAVAVDGDAVANARPEVSARLLTYVLGADVATTPVAASASGLAQQHLITPTSLLPYLTVDQRWADEVERQTDVKVTGVTIDGEAGRPLKFTANLVTGGTSYQRDVASALTPAREGDQPLFFPGASVVIDGASNTAITKFSAQIQRGVDSDIRTTQLTRDDVLELNYDTQIDFTLKYESRDLYQKVYYGGGSQISPDAIAGVATGSFKIFTGFNLGGASERFLELSFPTYDLTAARVNRLDPDGKTMYIDVTAMGRRGATHSFWARVQTASGGAF